MKPVTDEIKTAITAAIMLLPGSESEFLTYTTPGLLNDEVRNNVFQARSQLDDLLTRLRRANNPLAPRVWDIVDLLQHDRLHFEAIISHPDGQTVVRENVKTAAAKLKTILTELQ